MRLPNIKLAADGWRAVFEALRKGACPRLTTLDLNGCELGPCLLYTSDAADE